MRFASWNVRTMTTGLNEDLTQIDDNRKTAVIAAELERLNIDIAALQETRLSETGTLKEKSHTFFWQGRPSSERREHGVGFAVRNSLLPMIEPPRGGTERLLGLHLHTRTGSMNILSVYAPTMAATTETKDEFYTYLEQSIAQLPRTEQLLILGDFNARVGDKHDHWPRCLGHFGVGNMNENGQRLLELCTNQGLCVTNTYFSGRPMHKVSWMHPRSRQWHQLDLILTRRTELPIVRNTRSYHSADCNTDHTLIASTVCLKPKKKQHGKPKCAPKINTTSTLLADNLAQFAELMNQPPEGDPPGDAAKMWEDLSTTIHKNSLQAFGKRNKTSQDWYEASISVMGPATEAKRKAMICYKQNPNRHTFAALKAAEKKSRDLARESANAYWLSLCNEIENASARGDTKAMFDGIKRATGPSPVKTAPLRGKDGQVITDQGKVMDRWVEHYLELYATCNTVTEGALNNCPHLPILIDLDNEPTTEELGKAIDALKCNKAPGEDGIPPEVIKRCKTTLLKPLHDLLVTCWQEGQVPQSMRDAKIITLYKNKGDRSDCNNYRGISLLSIVGKVFARVLLPRLQALGDRVYPESQCGFRPGRSTIDMIFSIRQLQEKCREQRQPLFIAFVDLTKAFDLVSRNGLFALLKRIGCPPTLLSLISSFHTNMHGFVSFNNENSTRFEIRSGVKQGCVLAPTLFGIFFSLLLHHAFKSNNEGVLLHTRHDGKLFNIARLRAKTKVKQVLIREMLFADDAAFVSHSEDGLQALIDCFAGSCQEFGLTISIKKTEVMALGTPDEPSIKISNQPLNAVDSFKYLGSTVTSNHSLDTELSARIGKAAMTFGSLTKRVWQNQKLRLKTKLKVYSTCVLSSLLYGSESWPTYARQERRLNQFHIRCIRKLLNISWRDKVTNQEVLRRAGIPSIHSLLSEKRLRWLGHVRRMGPERLPKDLLYGQLAQGTRKTGRPLLRFKDVCKRDLQACKINVDSWEDLANERTKWRSSVKIGCKTAEQERAFRLDEKRQRRKASANLTPESTFPCDRCGRQCRSRIGLHSHQRKCRF